MRYSKVEFFDGVKTRFLKINHMSTFLLEKLFTQKYAPVENDETKQPYKRLATGQLDQIKHVLAFRYSRS